MLKVYMLADPLYFFSGIFLVCFNRRTGVVLCGCKIIQYCIQNIIRWRHSLACLDKQFRNLIGIFEISKWHYRLPLEKIVGLNMASENNPVELHLPNTHIRYLTDIQS